jgi:hypothetical protein
MALILGQAPQVRGRILTIHQDMDCRFWISINIVEKVDGFIVFVVVWSFRDEMFRIFPPRSPVRE